METPQISNYTYASNTINCDQADYLYRSSTSAPAQGLFKNTDFQGSLLQNALALSSMQPKKETPMADKIGRRFVRVIIIDPEESVPLDKCILYSSEEKLTDLTDAELFFEVDIKPLLEKHNAMRQQIVDKKMTHKLGKEMLLEPVRIRDLKMTVVDIASF